MRNEYIEYFEEYQDILNLDDSGNILTITFSSTDGSQKITCMIDVEDWLTIDRYFNETTSLYEGICHGPIHLRQIFNDIIAPVYSGFDYLKDIEIKGEIKWM